MNGVMPVVIVIGGLSVPTAVVRFKRVMGPANAAISAPNNNSLAGETELPDLRRVGVTDSRLDRLRSPRSRRRFSHRTGFRKEIFNVRIAFYPRNIGPGCEGLRDLAGSLHQNCVHDVERAMLKAALP